MMSFLLHLPAWQKLVTMAVLLLIVAAVLWSESLRQKHVKAREDDIHSGETERLSERNKR